MSRQSKIPLKPDAELALRKVSDLIRQRSPRAISVEGHTDSIGGAGYNFVVSKHRANFRTFSGWIAIFEVGNSAGRAVMSAQAIQPDEATSDKLTPNPTSEPLMNPQLDGGGNSAPGISRLSQKCWSRTKRVQGEREVSRIFVALMISAAFGLTTYFGVAAWYASRDSDIPTEISVSSDFK